MFNELTIWVQPWWCNLCDYSMDVWVQPWWYDLYDYIMDSHVSSLLGYTSTAQDYLCLLSEKVRCLTQRPVKT